MAPVLSSVVPNSGPAAGNTIVTLNGSGFAGTTGVSFGAAPALAYTVNSATKITATAPPGSGTVQVSVKQPGGVTSNSLPYTYVVVPTLTSVSPSQGPSAGGTTVTLTGTGLSGATAVSFGATPASSFTVNSATQITAVVPAGTGTVPVTVTTTGGTSNPVYFVYLSAPVLILVSPSEGPTAGGTTVTLSGSDFTGATAVSFGATPASSFTVNSANQITAVAPAGTGTVPVTVTTAGGTSNPISYSYVAPPSLTSLVPAFGPTSAGNSVTITGINLTSTQAVHFSGVPAAFTVLSDTSVVAIAPPGPAGTGFVNVTTLGGTSNNIVYTRVAPPEI